MKEQIFDKVMGMTTVDPAYLEREWQFVAKFMLPKYQLEATRETFIEQATNALVDASLMALPTSKGFGHYEERGDKSGKKSIF
jgi:acetoacetate decarboxylase